MKTVNIKGVIVGDDEKWIYDWFGIAAVSPQSVYDELAEANGEDVDVIINSGGGSVFAGSEIFAALKQYKGGTIARVVGLAASAASVIAMACDLVAMAPTAQMMIHNAWSRVTGDYRDMEHGAKFLQNTNTSIANAYRLKTGKSEEDLKRMMNAETWMTAQDAVKEGFADEVMFDEQKQLAASAPFSGMLPEEVVNKVRMLLAESGAGKINPPLENQASAAEENEKQQRIMSAKIKLMKLKGSVVEDE
ncbi:putative peptidase [Paenibacillus sp. 598K]|uniref:head maturation protease, ClpP-related n=1 Tax=Paenibacillus sp. 598K TaxID=1117987 RepID=UPI000FFA95C2|nr:head maturation protease, ClpP-related [Paenibacillus sp. 598K]GBF73218.1 putative peptidase [Paenibacillus sp. 598K]